MTVEPAARVGRSHGLGYNEPTGLDGSVGERARGHLVPPSPASQDRYAGLTGPAMKGRGQRSIPRARPVAPAVTRNGEGSTETLAVVCVMRRLLRSRDRRLLSGQGLTVSHWSYTPFASPGA